MICDRRRNKKGNFSGQHKVGHLAVVTVDSDDDTSCTILFNNKKHYNHLPGRDEMFHERIEDSEACEENENNLRNTVTAY